MKCLFFFHPHFSGFALSFVKRLTFRPVIADQKLARYLCSLVNFAVTALLIAPAWQKSNAPACRMGWWYFVTHHMIWSEVGRAVHVCCHLAGHEYPRAAPVSDTADECPSPTVRIHVGHFHPLRPILYSFCLYLQDAAMHFTFGHFFFEFL